MAYTFKGKDLDEEEYEYQLREAYRLYGETKCSKCGHMRCDHQYDFETELMPCTQFDHCWCKNYT